jgi:hypothetical protein
MGHIYSRKTLEATLKEWETDYSAVDVVCATVAFGLGYVNISTLVPMV